ncbi:MAG: glycosyltransferase family 4 protein [Chloroflexi bacterium]|nr:glycosyltransferase family 4 protein [Chloroflexota bacterium]
MQAAGQSNAPGTSAEGATALKVLLLARREVGVTGTSRYAASLLPALRGLGLDAQAEEPARRGGPALAPLSRRLPGVDLGAFFAHYPLTLPRHDADVYHLSSQNLASALAWRRPRPPVVVTVHDIIPYLLRDDPRLCSYRHPVHRWFDRLAMHGLTRADALLADSHWTKGTLVERLDIPAGRIQVAPLGVDRERFRPCLVPDSFWARYGLRPDARYLLYVGSEDPRKNLEALLRALPLVQASHPDLRLLKVGAPYHLAERARLQALAQRLGVQGMLHWLDAVPEDDLPLFYNAARVFVLPSLYEGFGLPVLEALACGTPVVCANAAALPEVAGADSRLCPPVPGALAQAIAAALAPDPSPGARDARIQWAGQFTWERAAREARAVYDRVTAARPGGASR